MKTSGLIYSKKSLPLSVGLIGRMLRALSRMPGKGFLANRLIAPILRGRKIETIVEMENPGGGKLICNLDDWIPWNVFIHGCYIVEKNCESFMLNIARGSQVIIDVGANIGYYSVQFGKLTNGKVYSFEPMSYQFNTLKRNITLNKLENVIPLKLIVTDAICVKRIFFSSMNNTGMSSLEVKSEEYEDVNTTSLDHYCKVNKIKEIDIVKIDVEGHELSVLKGMSKLLSEKMVRNLFIEMNSHTLRLAGTSINSVVRFLQSYGYTGHSILTVPTKRYEKCDEPLVYFTHPHN